MEFVHWTEGEGDGPDLLFHGFSLPGMEASSGLVHLVKEVGAGLTSKFSFSWLVPRFTSRFKA